MNLSMDKLRALFPWPAKRPDLPIDEHGWLHQDTAALLDKNVKGARIIVEVGTWLGMSTRYMLERAPDATIVCVDTWLGSFELFRYSMESERIARLYEQFLANRWDLRERIVPVRLDSISGIKLAAFMGVTPELVYIDGGHEYEIVSADLREVTRAWPNAKVVLDDHAFEGVGRACADSGRAYTVHGYAAEL